MGSQSNKLRDEVNMETVLQFPTNEASFFFGEYNQIISGPQANLAQDSVFEAKYDRCALNHKHLE